MDNIEALPMGLYSVHLLSIWHCTRHDANLPVGSNDAYFFDSL
jgi:hypothetical protein